MSQPDTESLSFSDLLASCEKELAAIKLAIAANDTETLRLAAPNLEKVILGLCTALDNSLDNDHEEEEKAKLFSLVKDVVELNVVPSDETLFAIVPHTLRLFSICTETFEEESKQPAPLVINYVVKLIADLTALPTFGQKPSEEEEDDTAGEGNADDVLGLDRKLSHREYHLFAFSQSQPLILQLLSDHKEEFARLANSLLSTLFTLLEKTEYPQMKAECTELIAQIGLLALTPEQVKRWEDLNSHEEFLESVLEEEEGELSIPSSVTDYKEYEGFPYSALIPLLPRE
eukprot:TRINITY_DN2577_c0_g1_i1.p1 TRINITY_DN2577_c0_g1~~TRINITY_DN2577_c0_g1_i1.p1  ORF type:complete len:288 (+),score=49.52 TRINITY_DN2577_c0_g1_i1:47-910(+)